MNTQKEEFRKWMLDTFGRQDANDYAGTFTEEIAIEFADFKQKLNKHSVSGLLSCRYCNSKNILKDGWCDDCGRKNRPLAT